MANQGFLNNTELDFAAYKQSLKTYLSQQTEFRDYDFEGSNLSVLLDLLAYNTYHNAMYLNMIGSEMFLDTAQLRDSIVSHAKELNYTPRSRAASTIDVTITALPANTPETITLPRYYSIRGTNDANETYTFTTNETIVLYRSNNYTFSNVSFYEGSIKTEAFVANSANNQTFTLSSNTLDVSSITVEVRNSSTDTTTVAWNKANELFGLNSNSAVFFVQGADEFKYGVSFGNGVSSKKLTAGNIVLVSYRQTAGEDGNGCGIFTSISSADGFSSNTFILTTTESSSGGSQAEDAESIRYNAIRGFTNQNRAVTAEDFISLIKANYPSLETVIAYGGEEAVPKRYGKVIISAKPVGGETLSSSLKNSVLTFLQDKTPLSIEPEIVDPEYLYLDIISRVKYNISATTKTPSQLVSNVVTAITAFNTSYLSDFGADLRFSKLSAAIDDADVSIVSNDTEVRISKRIVPTPLVSFSANWSFENQLYSENIRYVLPIGHEPIVSSSAFVYDGYTAYMQDNGTGALYIYTRSNGSTIVLNNNVGSVNYDTGEINITNLIVDSYDTDSIKIYAKTENADIDTLTNKILLIDNEDISVVVTGIRI
jgi:hypothetical protein